MTDLSLLHSLLSKTKKFTWDFCIHSRSNFGIPSNIAVFAFSVEEARREVLAKLHEIFHLSPEYNRLQKEAYPDDILFDKVDRITLLQNQELLLKQCNALFEQLNVDDNTGFCDGIFDYTPTLLVTSSSGEITLELEKFISQIDPKVSKINTMSVYVFHNG